MEKCAACHGAWSFQVGKLEMRYEGDFIISDSNGDERRLKHGTGIMRWPDGREYQGQFKLDKMHGKGMMSWPDGTTYVGQYVNDKKEGIGKIRLPDGSRFEGNFYKGMRHGEILYVKPDGSAFHLEFDSDQVVGKESIPSFEGWTLKSGYSIFIKSEENADFESDDEPMCCICMDEMRCGDTCCITPCQHAFHKECLDAWVRQRNRCPLCVQKIPLQQVFEM